MKLFIDTSDSERIIVGIDGEKFEEKSRKEKSQILIYFLDKLLKKKNLNFQDIKEIRVNTGPGSFTGLRVGVSVAAALGWVLGIPVNGKILRKGEKLGIKYE